MTETLTERHRDFERFLTFIDAIVAIAITLLVLPLVELTADVNHKESVLHLLQHREADLGAFLLSFIVISRMWFAQHQAIRDVMLFDTAVARLLVLWTLTLVFLPFPTALVAKAGEQATTKVLYLGTIGVSLLALVLLNRAVARNRGISLGGTTPYPAGAILNLMWLCAALLVMLIFPGTSYFPLLLLMLEAPSLRLWTRLRA